MPSYLRYSNKTDTWENWQKAKNFVPLKGELINYTDCPVSFSNKKINRIKFGDGETLVNDLPFVDQWIEDNIRHNTAVYISNNGEFFDSIEQLQNYSGEITDNDYAFVKKTDISGNQIIECYFATVENFVARWDKGFEFANNLFNRDQFDAINSGITAQKVQKIDEKVDKEEGKGLSTNDYDNLEKQKVQDSYQDKHTHANKNIIDGIGEDDITKWNNKIASISMNGSKIEADINNNVNIEFIINSFSQEELEEIWNTEE